MESVVDKMVDEERKILKQFKESLDVDLNSSHTDELLVKFLRAKSFNLKATKKIFLENYYNRLMFGVNTVLDTYIKPEVAEKYETTGILGFAKDGTLIHYMAGGRLDFYGFIMSMSCLELCVYFAYLMELDIKALQEESLRTGKNVSEVTYIMDLEDLSLQNILHKCVIEMGLDYIRLLQDCYPEIWRNILVVNAPKIVDTTSRIFKGVMRSPILDKMQFANKDTTKDLLLKYIDEAVLPVFLGGKRVDSNGDPLCKEFISFGGKIPEKFYSKNCKLQVSLEDPEVRLIDIAPGSVFNLCFKITEANSTTKGYARSENGSLSVSLLYKAFDPDPENTELPGEFEYLDEYSKNSNYKRLSVEMRAQLHCAQQEIVIWCPWPGIYVMRLGNANSWFASRKFYVKVKVSPPNSTNAPQEQH